MMYTKDDLRVAAQEGYEKGLARGQELRDRIDELEAIIRDLKRPHDRGLE